MALYYTNASEDNTWENLANWNTAEDGSGVSPDHIPWGQNQDTCFYYDQDLIDVFGSGIVINQPTQIGQGATGTCNINYITNLSAICGGSYTGSGHSNMLGATISNSYFTGFLENSSNSSIYTSTFTQGIGNDANIYSGTFEIIGFTIYDFSYINYSGINVTYNGSPYTGSWAGQTWVNGSLFDWNTQTIYYTNSNSDGSWGNTANWNTSSAGTGIAPPYPPWQDSGGGGSFAAGATLVDATNNAGVTIDIVLGAGITGTCNISNITIDATGSIQSGTFTGSNYTNYNSCSGARFGNNFDNTMGARVINCRFGLNFSDWSVDSCYFESDGTFLEGGKNYTYNDGFAAIEYPAGGGGSALVSRLLNLPWFIKM